MLVEAKLTKSRAGVAVGRLGFWLLHRVSVAAVVPAALRYRHNMSAANALYLALTKDLRADFLTDDHRLAEAPTFPPRVNVFRLSVRP